MTLAIILLSSLGAVVASVLGKSAWMWLAMTVLGCVAMVVEAIDDAAEPDEFAERDP